MATNREKYIDNASNEELARMLNEQATMFDYEEGLYFEKNSFCDEKTVMAIAKWLSQEAENDNTLVNNLSNEIKKNRTI